MELHGSIVLKNNCLTIVKYIYLHNARKNLNNT